MHLNVDTSWYIRYRSATNPDFGVTFPQALNLHNVTAIPRNNNIGLVDEQLQFSRRVLRNYGNMSSPTVMYVLDEVVRTGNPQPGDWGVMVAVGPGMAAEADLLRW
jgi:3-oxoacyl-[acyl-carrier-protein] synthase III